MKLKILSFLSVCAFLFCGVTSAAYAEATPEKTKLSGQLMELVLPDKHYNIFVDYAINGLYALKHEAELDGKADSFKMLNGIDKKVLAKAIKDSFNAAFIREMLADFYSMTYSQEELKLMLDFATSKGGRIYMEKSPKILLSIVNNALSELEPLLSEKEKPGFLRVKQALSANQPL